MDGPCCVGRPFERHAHKYHLKNCPSANKRDKGLLESTYPGKSAMAAITHIAIVSIQCMVGVLLVFVRERYMVR